jgi:hypothetical protein
MSPAIPPLLSTAVSAGRWFRAVHVEDQTWHACALEPGDEGGES